MSNSYSTPCPICFTPTELWRWGVSHYYGVGVEVQALHMDSTYTQGVGWGAHYWSWRWKSHFLTWPSLTTPWQGYCGISLQPHECWRLWTWVLLSWVGWSQFFLWYLAGVEWLSSKSVLSWYSISFFVLWLEKAGFYWGFFCLCPLNFPVSSYWNSSSRIYKKQKQTNKISHKKQKQKQTQGIYDHGFLHILKSPPRMSLIYNF